MTEQITRPIIGIENRTPQEVFDIMCDRLKTARQLIEAEVRGEIAGTISGGCEMTSSKLSQRAPDRLWLLDIGHDDLVWSVDPDPDGQQTDGVEYVRAERVAALEAELSTALHEVAKWAREAGGWKGRYEVSELCGVVEGWQEKCAALEDEVERQKEIVRRVQASAKTLDATRSEIYKTYAENSKLNTEAVATLDSEREANAILTANITALEAENAKLREALRSLLTDWHDCMGSRDTKGERDARAALGGNHAD